MFLHRGRRRYGGVTVEYRWDQGGYGIKGVRYPRLGQSMEVRQGFGRVSMGSGTAPRYGGVRYPKTIRYEMQEIDCSRAPKRIRYRKRLRYARRVSRARNQRCRLRIPKLGLEVGCLGRAVSAWVPYSTVYYTVPEWYGNIKPCLRQSSWRAR